MALEQESYFQVENNIFQMQSCDCFVAEGEKKDKGDILTDITFVNSFLKPK